MGNSEVGHLTIGAGRIIRQELVRISDTVRSNQLGDTPALKELAERTQQRGGTLHLLGSRSGVFIATWTISVD